MRDRHRFELDPDSDDLVSEVSDLTVSVCRLVNYQKEFWKHVTRKSQAPESLTTEAQTCGAHAMPDLPYWQLAVAGNALSPRLQAAEENECVRRPRPAGRSPEAQNTLDRSSVPGPSLRRQNAGTARARGPKQSPPAARMPNCQSFRPNQSPIDHDRSRLLAWSENSHRV